MQAVPWLLGLNPIPTGHGLNQTRFYSKERMKNFSPLNRNMTDLDKDYLPLPSYFKIVLKTHDDRMT